MKKTMIIMLIMIMFFCGNAVFASEVASTMTIPIVSTLVGTVASTLNDTVIEPLLLKEGVQKCTQVAMKPLAFVEETTNELVSPKMSFGYEFPQKNKNDWVDEGLKFSLAF